MHDAARADRWPTAIEVDLDLAGQVGAVQPLDLPGIGIETEAGEARVDGEVAIGAVDGARIRRGEHPEPDPRYWAAWRRSSKSCRRRTQAPR